MAYYDILLAKQLSGGGGGGGDISVESKNINANGTYTAPSGKAYSPVNVNVPNSYSASDEGKVVSSGALVSQSSQSIDTNGTYDTTLKNEVVVNVSGGSSVDVEALSVTQNGTYTAPSGTAYSPVTVNVSGGGGASNVVSGTFTPTTTGSFEISTSYSGSGYPIAFLVWRTSGLQISTQGMVDYSWVKLNPSTPVSSNANGYALLYSKVGTSYTASYSTSASINRSTAEATLTKRLGWKSDAPSMFYMYAGEDNANALIKDDQYSYIAMFSS